ncbi:hypothetical protein [Polaromonas sp.]|uniref:hypothetical protein n=1 Tax=Polaromonas sp. TaxID=1869339 RepID=UPI001797435A|nr:hypothetical protein [Polaromonas sp.]NML84734.1 hypothetical protein [Polaromonas sp.]
MHLSGKLPLLMMAATVPVFSACAQSRPDRPASATSGMSFFVTSANPGKGADLGGLARADQYCQKLATMAGGGGTWRAYLSNSAVSAPPALCLR